MGTSKSNGGPKDNSPLLPPWAPPPEVTPESAPQPNDQNDSQELPEEGSNNTEDTPKEADGEQNPIANIGNWNSARRALGSSTRSGGTANLGRAAKSYVRAMGGAGNATRASSGGIITGARYGSFLSDVVNRGVQQALTSLGIGEHIGKSASFVFSKIADMIAPNPALPEEAVAREALLESMKDLIKEYELEGKDIESLDNLGKDDMALCLESYISNYIYFKWLQALGLSLEKKEIPESQLVKLEKDAKKLIRNSVQIEAPKSNLLKTDFSTTGTGKKIMESIFALAFSLIEAL